MAKRAGICFEAVLERDDDVDEEGEEGAVDDEDIDEGDEADDEAAGEALEEAVASRDVFEGEVEGAPLCQGCNEPMLALALLHADPERLPLTRHAAIGVFVCPRESGDDWDAWWNECALANPDAKGGLAVKFFDEAPKVTGGVPARYRKRKDVDADDEDDGPFDGTKLGGKARWSTATDPSPIPKCSVCRAKTRFIGQVTSDTQLTFEAGDGFHIYVYTCAEEHTLERQAFVD